MRTILSTIAVLPPSALASSLSPCHAKLAPCLIPPGSRGLAASDPAHFVACGRPGRAFYAAAHRQVVNRSAGDAGRARTARRRGRRRRG